MMKSRMLARKKIAQMPKIVTLPDYEVSRLIQEAELEAADVLELLEGHDLGLLDTEDIWNIPAEVIFQALKLHKENIKEHSQDSNVLAWQRNGGFNDSENPAAMMVSGFEVDFRKVRTMDEKILREWIIKYFEMLRSEQHH